MGRKEYARINSDIKARRAEHVRDTVQYRSLWRVKLDNGKTAVAVYDGKMEQVVTFLGKLERY